MKRFLYILWQWIWGLPQNLVGAALYLFFRITGCPHFRYQGALVTVWPIKSGSMSMGRFLFLDPTWEARDHFLLAHEYGHTIQSLMLGPLFLILVGLPSILWAGLPYFERLRRKKDLSYYDAYQENWANKLGARFAKPENDPKVVPLSRKERKALLAAPQGQPAVHGQAVPGKSAGIAGLQTPAPGKSPGKSLPAAWKQAVQQAQTAETDRDRE